MIYDLENDGLQKYFKLKQMKMPDDAIQSKMKLDGIETNLIDQFFDGRYKKRSFCFFLFFFKFFFKY